MTLLGRLLGPSAVPLPGRLEEEFRVPLGIMGNTAIPPLFGHVKVRKRALGSIRTQPDPVDSSAESLQCPLPNRVRVRRGAPGPIGDKREYWTNLSPRRFSPPMLGLGRGTQDGFRLAEGLGPEVTWLGTKPKDRLGLAVGSWSQLGSV